MINEEPRRFIVRPRLKKWSTPTSEAQKMIHIRNVNTPDLIIRSQSDSKLPPIFPKKLDSQKQLQQENNDLISQI